MRPPQRGEVGLVDLGMAAKVRPCLVLSVPPSDADRALVTLVPHTTSLRSSQFEVVFPVPFLKPGGFDAQSLVTVPPVRFLRIMGRLSPEQIAQVESRVCTWLGLKETRG